jgi:hypothetical protein
MTQPLLKFGGWFNSALGVGGLLVHAYLFGALFLALGVVLLTQGYRVSHVLGVRLPWVRGDTST